MVSQFSEKEEVQMGKEGKFRSVATTKENKNWDCLIKRPNELYSNSNEVRTEFSRDYTRILHSLAYRRLKHKTQVFFNIDNDHICTRMEHVAHVESVSNTIAQYLGLNTELTKAIAIGHDIGHAPFGHHGEEVINKLYKKHLGKKYHFWHEKNGLRFVDDIELLENHYKIYNNLNLTYAVRDGIISHCGEIDQNGLRPREEFIDLYDFKKPGDFQPATWEGCVVKIADKIAYVGRDIEDAICLGFLNDSVKNKLKIMARINDEAAVNTTVIMHNMIIDICENSSPEKGICLSEKYYKQLNEIKEFNYKYIYNHERLSAFKAYSKIVIKNIFNKLLRAYAGEFTWEKLRTLENESLTLVESFSKWLSRYCDTEIVPENEKSLKELALKCENNKIYGRLENKEVYVQAILDYLAGMTDRFAIKIFNEFLAY